MSDKIRITEIHTESFKGQSGSTKVGILNLVEGPNGSGKSTLLMATRFSLTGQTDLGKRPEDNVDLFGPRGGAAGLQLSDGSNDFQFKRRLVRDNAEHRLSQGIFINGRDDIGLRQGEVILREKVGEFAPMWSVNAFLGLSIDKQRAFILDLSAKASPAGATMSASDLMSRAVLEMLCSDPDVGRAVVNAECFRTHQVSIDELAPGLRPPLAERIAKAQWGDTKYAAVLEAIQEVSSAINGDMAESIAAAIARGGELVAYSKRNEDEARASIRALSDRKQEFNDVAGDLSSLQSVLSGAETAEKTLIQNIGQAEGRESSETQTKSRIESIDREILLWQGKVREIESLPPVPSSEQIELQIADVAQAMESAQKLVEDGLKIEQTKLEASSNARAVLKNAEGGKALIDETNTAIESLKHQIGNADQAIIGLESIQDPEKPEHLEHQAAEIEAANPKPEDKTPALRTEQQAASQAEFAASNESRRLEQDLFALRTDEKQAKDNPWLRLRKLYEAANGDGDAWVSMGVLILEQTSNLKSADVIAGNISAKEFALNTASQNYEAAKSKRVAADKALENAGANYQSKWTAYQLAQSQALQLRSKAAKIRNEAEIRSASLKSHRDRRARMQADLEAKEAELAKLTVSGDMKELQKAADEAAVALQRHRLEIDSLKDDVSDHRRTIDRLREQLTSLQSDRQKRTDDIVHHNELIAGLQKQRTEAVSLLEELTSSRKGDDLSGLRQKRLDVQASIEETKAKIDRKTRFDLLSKEFDAATLKAEQQRIFHDVCKSLVKALKVIRETIMRERVEPVVSRMDRFLAAAMPNTRAFCDLINDLEREDFALGWIRNGIKVTLPALSGGERAIYQAALLYALITLANPPLKTLLIEAAEIDQTNLLALIGACEAIADEVSNIFIATYAADAIAAMPGWTIIKAGRRAALEEQRPGRVLESPDLKLVNA